MAAVTFFPPSLCPMPGSAAALAERASRQQIADGMLQVYVRPSEPEGASRSVFDMEHVEARILGGMSEPRESSLEASQLEALRGLEWQAYSATFLVFRKGHVVFAGTRLFRDLPTPLGLQRALESIAIESDQGSVSVKGRFIITEEGDRVLAFLIDSNQQVDIDVVVRVRKQAILGKDGE